MLEEVLVEKLATQIWRYRRCLAAETAQFQRSIVLPDLRGEHHADASIVSKLLSEIPEETGLIHRIRASHVLDECLELLKAAKSEIRGSGNNRNNRISELLTKLFGSHSSGRQHEVPPELRYVDKDGKLGDLFESYERYARVDRPPERGSSNPEQCRQSFPTDLDHAIRKLENYKSIKQAEVNQERVRLCITDPSRLEHLLRYEASLERNIDRTLNRLERLRRMRLGQPVPPKLEVEHVCLES